MLGAALVVSSIVAATIVNEPTDPVVPAVAEIGDDYQSGSKHPHSKDCRQSDLCTGFI